MFEAVVGGAGSVQCYDVDTIPKKPKPGGQSGTDHWWDRPIDSRIVKTAPVPMLAWARVKDAAGKQQSYLLKGLDAPNLIQDGVVYYPEASFMDHELDWVGTKKQDLPLIGLGGDTDCQTVATAMTDWFNTYKFTSGQTLNDFYAHRRNITVRCNTDPGTSDIYWAPPPVDACPDNLISDFGECVHGWGWKTYPGQLKNWLYIEDDDAATADISVGDLVEGELDPGQADNLCGCEDGLRKALADGGATSRSNLTCFTGRCGAVRHRARVIEVEDITSVCTPPIRLMSTEATCNRNNWDQKDWSDQTWLGWSSKAWDAYETMGGKINNGGVRKLALDCTNAAFHGNFPLYGCLSANASAVCCSCSRQRCLLLFCPAGAKAARFGATVFAQWRPANVPIRMHLWPITGTPTNGAFPKAVSQVASP